MIAPMRAPPKSLIAAITTTAKRVDAEDRDVGEEVTCRRAAADTIAPRRTSIQQSGSFVDPSSSGPRFRISR